MADCHSTIQLVEHDETTRALERDNGATAFELDASCLAPEILPGIAPQLLHRSSLPEVNGSIEESGEQSADRASSKSIKFWIRIIVAFAIIVATVAVGDGIGIWRTGRARSSTISAQPLKTTFVTNPVSSPSLSISSAPRSPIATRATNATNTASPFSAPSTPTSTALTPPPAYATGTCHFHLQEWQNCEPSKNLFAIVDMVDNDGNDIGNTQVNPDKDALGEPINDSDPYSFTSRLPYPLFIVGEHSKDYVQFYYRTLQWTSTITSGSAYCRIGGWVPVDGPVCHGNINDTFAENQIDCQFPC